MFGGFRRIYQLHFVEPHRAQPFDGRDAPRLSGVVVAALCAFVLTIDPALLGYVPKFVLGGLLLYLGGMLIYQWLMDSALRLSLVEYLSLLAIATHHR